MRRCVGGGSGGKSEKGWGGGRSRDCTDTGLSGSIASPQGALVGVGSQKRGLNVQDTGLVLALMLHKAQGVAPVGVDIERFSLSYRAVGGTKRQGSQR